MGLNKYQVHQIKESIKVGSFCKDWWKKLKKQINSCDITDFQKIQVLEKISMGLIDECLAMSNDVDKEMILKDLGEFLSDKLMEVKHG